VVSDVAAHLGAVACCWMFITY